MAICGVTCKARLNGFAQGANLRGRDNATAREHQKRLPAVHARLGDAGIGFGGIGVDHLAKEQAFDLEGIVSAWKELIRRVEAFPLCTGARL